MDGVGVGVVIQGLLKVEVFHPFLEYVFHENLNLELLDL